MGTREQARAAIALLRLLLVLALVAGLVGCSRETSADPVLTVIRHLDAMKSNDHDAWASTMTKDAQTGLVRVSSGEFGVISLAVHSAAISDEVTRRMKERYSGSELARQLKWSDAHISQDMVVVSARYTVDYDNAVVPNNDGTVTQDFILVRTDERSQWLIWDSTSPAR